LELNFLQQKLKAFGVCFFSSFSSLHNRLYFKRREILLNEIYIKSIKSVTKVAIEGKLDGQKKGINFTKASKDEIQLKFL
jgi:uncharacterized protein (UPF0210 family)